MSEGDKQYGSDDVEISWFGIDIKKGVAAGSFIQDRRNAQTWSQKDSGTGDVVQVKNPSKSGTLTITLDVESITHEELSDLAEVDDQLKNAASPLVVEDNSKGLTFIYEKARPTGLPDEGRGTEGGTVQWTFIYARRRRVPGPKGANVIVEPV